jgi:hypothetical protein
MRLLLNSFASLNIGGQLILRMKSYRSNNRCCRKIDVFGRRNQEYGIGSCANLLSAARREIKNPGKMKNKNGSILAVLI